MSDGPSQIPPLNEIASAPISRRFRGGGLAAATFGFLGGRSAGRPRSATVVIRKEGSGKIGT